MPTDLLLHYAKQATIAITLRGNARGHKHRRWIRLILTRSRHFFRNSLRAQRRTALCCSVSCGTTNSLQRHVHMIVGLYVGSRPDGQRDAGRGFISIARLCQTYCHCNRMDNLPYSKCKLVTRQPRHPQCIPGKVGRKEMRSCARGHPPIIRSFAFPGYGMTYTRQS